MFLQRSAPPWLRSMFIWLFHWEHFQDKWHRVYRIWLEGHSFTSQKRQRMGTTRLARNWWQNPITGSQRGKSLKSIQIPYSPQLFGLLFICTYAEVLPYSARRKQQLNIWKGWADILRETEFGVPVLSDCRILVNTSGFSLKPKKDYTLKNNYIADIRDLHLD